MEPVPSPASGARGPAGSRERLLLSLKERGPLGLQALSAELGISRVAVLRHLARLESEGLVRRAHEGGRVGRPRALFSLTDSARPLFPQAYAEVSVQALRFVERKLGRPAVVELLQGRAHELADQHRPGFPAGPLEARTRHLAELRDREGYMAAFAGRRGRAYELLEHNCPIFAIAREFPEACQVELRLFESLLGARVEASHRVVAGDPVCRFLVRPRASGSP